MSASSTSSRSTSSRRISESSRSNGPAKTSRSSSRCCTALATADRRLGVGADGTDAHGRADVRHHRRRERARPLRALSEDLLEAALVTAQLVVALAHGRQPLGDRVADGALEVAVAAALELTLDLLG